MCDWEDMGELRFISLYTFVMVIICFLFFLIFLGEIVFLICLSILSYLLNFVGLFSTIYIVAFSVSLLFNNVRCAT